MIGSKTFKKLLSAIMITSMITLAVSNGTPVQAAVKASDYLSATKKYLHLGREESNSYNFNIKNKKSGSTYAWYVKENKGNPNAVKINEKNGIVTANEAGTAHIGVKITYANGTVVSPEAKVTVRNNISEVDISNRPENNIITVDKPMDFNRVILNTEAGKDKTASGITRWELADDNAGANEVSSKGLVTATKEGTFMLRAVSFQSKEKYNLWLTDKEANAEYVTAASEWYVVTAEQEIIATNPVLFELRVNDMPVDANDITISDNELNQINTMAFHLTEEAARAEFLVTTTLANGTVVHEILADEQNVQYFSADISAMRAKFGQLPEGVYNFTLKLTNNVGTQSEKIIVLTAKSQATVEAELAKAATEAINALFVDANAPNNEKVLAEGVNQAQIDAATALVDKLADENTKLFGHAAIAIAQDLLDTKLAKEADAARIEEAIAALEGLFVDAKAPDTGKQLAEGVDQAKIDETLAFVNDAMDKAQELLDKKLAEEAEAKKAPTLVSVTPAKDTTVELNHDEAFTLEVKANDTDLRELEVDHNLTTLPEFSVYASEENPYGDATSKEAFENMGVDVTYTAATQTWIINFGEVVTDAFVEKGNVTFYLVLSDEAGNAWGSMDPTTEENKFQYTVSKKEVPDTEAPTLVSVTPEKDSTVELDQDGTFALEVKANDANLRELEVDHNMTNLPEFSVYASEENPYGDAAAKEDFDNLGVNVTYNAATQTWIIDFGRDVTDAIVAKSNVSFYLIVKDEAGNVWGSMDPTTEANTFKYTVTQK